MTRHGLALKVCLAVFDLKMFAYLVGEVFFSLEQLLMMRRDSVGLMIALCCLIGMNDALMFCSLISMVSSRLIGWDLFSRIFLETCFDGWKRSLNAL